MPLTDAKIRSLKPRDKPDKVSDFGGHYVSVVPTGSLLWHMKYRFEGREKRLFFGPFPVVSLARARKQRDEAKALLAKDQDPGAAKQQAKRALNASVNHTFERLADGFLEKGRTLCRFPPGL